MPDIQAQKAGISQAVRKLLGGGGVVWTDQAMEVLDFTELYNRYSGDVFRYARYLTGSREVAEEVTAETFLRAWTVQDNLRVATAKGYLIAVARNLVRDGYRRGRREVELAGEVAAREAQPETRRYLDQTLAAIGELDEKYREPLLMQAVAGLPYEEIARVLGLPLNTAKIRVHRARLMLDKKLQREEKCDDTAK